MTKTHIPAFCGWHVPAEMPESYNKGQGLEMKKVDILPDSCDKYYLLLKEENGVYKDITGSVSDEKGKKWQILFSSQKHLIQNLTGMGAFPM